MDTWLQKLLESRKQKDAAFGSGQGPLHDTSDFAGLLYYEPDADYKFVTELNDEPIQHLDIPRTGGDSVRYERVGTFTLPFPEGEAKIAAYRTEAHGHQLFIPFRDMTSGKETYGAGRYLEARPLKDGRWYLDFNRCYNPFCAYNEEYTCPLPPIENWLKVAVKAGEKYAE